MRLEDSREVNDRQQTERRNRFGQVMNGKWMQCVKLMSQLCVNRFRKSSLVRLWKTRDVSDREHTGAQFQELVVHRRGRRSDVTRQNRVLLLVSCALSRGIRAAYII